jgi:iron complex outermembrane receptor protein
MKKFSLMLLLQLMAVIAFGQMNLTGLVKGDGEVLAGASVVIEKSFYGVSTRANGSFEFKNLKPGNYTLLVSFVGFEPQEVPVSVPTTEPLEINLKASNFFTDEVQITATRAGNKTPVAFTNLSKQELDANNSGQDIPYLLGITPSLVQSSEAGAGIGYTSFRIRGTDPTRINVTIDGVPLNDSESQGVFWPNMPDFASSVENVQIQRGVGTSTNGAAAFGATINFQTQNVNPNSYAEITSMAGSFNTFKNSVKVGTGIINDHFTFDARFSKLNSDGYIDYGFSDHKSMFMAAGYHTEKSSVKAKIIHGDQRTGITWWGNPDVEGLGRTYNPAGEYVDEYGQTQYYEDQTDNYKQTHFILNYSSKLSESLHFNTSLHYTRGKGYYEQYKQDESFPDYGLEDVVLTGGEIISTTDLIRQKWLDNHFYGMVFGLSYQKEALNFTLGGGWNKYDGDHYGNITWMRYAGKSEKDYEWYLNNGKKTDYNLYAKTSYQLTGVLSAYADIQLRGINYDITGIDDDRVDMTMNHDFLFVNPKLGLFAQLDAKNAVYASFALAHREPTRANFKEAKGDPASTPSDEALYDYEAGYKFNGNTSAFGANLYYMFYRDQLVPTGEKSSVGYDIMTNVDKSYRLGIELTGGLKITTWLKWDANLTLSSNKIIDYVDHTSGAGGDGVNFKELGNTDISYSPNVIANNIVSVMPFSNFDIKLISKYVGEQHFDNTSSTDRVIEAYFVNDLRFDYSLDNVLFSQVNLFAQINNLFDAKYSNNAYGGHWYENGKDYTWAYYFPQAGTNFMLGASFTF